MKNFLLKSETAIELYDHICDLPIIDYHCHLDPAAIASNARFENIGQLWLGGDHYKWRLMRMNGVPESHITGDAPWHEKFAAFCATIENAIGNPVYAWAHLELKKYFGFDGAITSENAAQIYAMCNTLMEADDFCVHGLLKKSRVEWLATTDDPADSLESHGQIKAAATPGVPKVLPTFRPGIVLEPDNPGFAAYLKRLGDAAKIPVTDWDSLLAALSQRLDFFAKMGCVISDHSLEPPIFEASATDESAAKVLAISGDFSALSQTQIRTYKTRLLAWLGGEYHARGWVMQLHMCPMRNNNSRMRRLTGADTGFDGISDDGFARPLAQILDDFESRNVLPKTVLYALNPASNDMLAVLAGCFAGRGIKGRIQWGAPWWFNDSKTGIENHLETLANHGLVANFIGMLTDSRSFISYPRHEYFRRILANRLARWVENGEFPKDMPRLKKIAEDIAYFNAKGYFDI